MTALERSERTAAKRPLSIALYAGLALSAIGAVAPYIDIATGDAIAAHVRDAYPDWPASEVRKDRDAIALALAVLGGLGAATWIAAIATAGRRWARWFITAAFAVGTVLATSIGFMGGGAYGTIAPPAYGVLATLPCLAGLAAVVLVWRRGGAG